MHKFEENGYNRVSLDGSSLPECPTTVLWIYYYLSQHFDRLKNYQRAHKYIDEALKHTPTLIELYMAKAKSYKHSGDFALASDLVVQAQELDTADRYLNSKCAKYLLRAGQIQQAEDMCAKFTRERMSASECLTEMQCMWFESECANAFCRLGKYGEALKKCHQIERHFVNFFEDQYDFHSYCLRKMTLSTYVKFLRFEDVLHKQPFYVRAATLAASIYLDMIDNPQKFMAKSESEEANMSAAELKKIRRKQNKAKAAQEKEKQNGQMQGGGKAQAKKRVDGELDVVESAPLDPQKLSKPQNPLEEAVKFVQPILQMPCDDVAFWVVAFRIYCHKNKPWIMLKCLNKIYRSNPNDNQLPDLFAKYMEKYNEFLSTSGTATVELLKEVTELLAARINQNKNTTNRA